MTTTTTNQTNHEPRPAWMELAEAKMHLDNLIRRQENEAEQRREIRAEYQRDLARELSKDRWGAEYAAEQIERTNRIMAEEKQAIERHELLATAYRAAAAIIEAVSGAYFYAACKGYYGTQIYKFPTAEARAAFLEDHEGTGWHEADDDDLNQIFWGCTIPTTPEA